MNSLLIRGNNEPVLSVELKHILTKIQHGAKFKWSILWLDAIGDLGRSMPAFEKEINNSPNGFLTGWDELLVLSVKLHQIIDMVLIGDTDEGKLKRYASDQEMYLACEYTIELIDSSYWIVHTKAGQQLGVFQELDGAELI
jgi:hypothetical protein